MHGFLYAALRSLLRRRAASVSDPCPSYEIAGGGQKRVLQRGAHHLCSALTSVLACQKHLLLLSLLCTYSVTPPEFSSHKEAKAHLNFCTYSNCLLFGGGHQLTRKYGSTIVFLPVTCSVFFVDEAFT